VLWVLGIFLGTQMSLGLVWKMSDALNGMMAIPNLIALLLLSPVVFKLTRQYYQQPADNTVEDRS
jgi:alanine or glycine:cation symporter, AGCS family